MSKKNQKARNERERKRVHQVNHGFDVLRNRLQPKNHTKKWSKADTLREAVKYIQQLQHLLNNESQQQANSTSADFQPNGDYFQVKEEFSMYLPQNYHHPQQAHPNPSMPSETFHSSPTSSTSSAYSPQSQMCFQTPAYYHNQ